MEPSPKLYRISWNMLGGHSGHGEYCFTQELGLVWITDLNKKYPDIHHWLE